MEGSPAKADLTPRTINMVTHSDFNPIYRDKILRPLYNTVRLQSLYIYFHFQVAVTLTLRWVPSNILNETTRPFPIESWKENSHGFK